MTGSNPIRGEEAIIQEYLAPLAAGYPGAFDLRDDCAAITPTPGHDLIVKTDPVAGGIHFFPDDPPEDIGWKALAVNVSDLAAKAAVPVAYLMALSFPEAPTRSWMERFARGLHEAQTAFGMHLIGGDTDRRPGPVTISITVFGEVPTGTMVRRGAARTGDLIYVSGELGAAATGLALLNSPDLAQDLAIAGDDVATLVARFRRPTPRLSLREALRRYASAAMDLSDGLAKDLDRMCRASSCGATIQVASVPVLPATAAALARDRAFIRNVIAAGDDYEVLATVAPEHAAAFEACVRGTSDVSVSCIGSVRADSGVALIAADGQPITLDRAGWDHF
ncbi:MAG TPA: thiamine-phosphate kinase [Hyphomicrobiaceae bacterium]|nr:thiamine-phosphate kinase [Hyphomicrobiaceae bacterium]